MGRSIPDNERFWPKVDKTGVCWVWVGAKRKANTPQPRGLFRYLGKNVSAHRVSWQMAYGVIPTGLFVCHKCDNSLCVRPDHLFLGTATDNMRDCAAKGRFFAQRHPEKMHWVRKGGAQCRLSKLKEQDVILARKMRAEGYTLAAIAAAIGSKTNNVWRIVHDQTWRNV